MRLKTFMAAVVFCAAMFTFGSGTQPATAEDMSGSAVEQLKAIEEDWAKAILARDKSKLAEIEADDYQFVMTDGTVRGKQEDIASLDDANYTEVSFDDLDVRVYGDTAVVIGRATMKGTEKGRDASGIYRYTDVFVKKDGRWQAVNTTAVKEGP